MITRFLLFFFLLHFINNRCVCQEGEQDTLTGYVDFFNGRIWTNRYQSFYGDPFLFVNYFLPGSVSVDGRTYPDVLLKYDINSDEILTPVNRGEILQLNKENVDSFSIFFSGEKLDFINIRDTTQGLSGYYHKASGRQPGLFVKYIKDILPSVVPGRDYEFVQFDKVFLERNNEFFQVRSVRELLTELAIGKEQARPYLRSNRIKLSGTASSAFIAVMKYYNSLE